MRSFVELCGLGLVKDVVMFMHIVKMWNAKLGVTDVIYRTGKIGYIPSVIVISVSFKAYKVGFVIADQWVRYLLKL